MIVKNDRERKFCQHVVDGMPLGEAYRKAGYAAKTGANAGAYALMQQGRIKAQIRRLRREAEEMCSLSRAEVLNKLVEIVETPAGHLHSNHPLCQELRVVETEKSTTTTIKLPSKMDAMKEISRICGFYDEPDSGDGMTPEERHRQFQHRLRTDSTFRQQFRLMLEDAARDAEKVVPGQVLETQESSG